jgi:hypothetical protein
MTQNKNIYFINLIPYIISNGYINLIYWILENLNNKNIINRARGIQYESCATAAQSGNLKILKFLKEKNFRWNSKTSEMAAENGNLELFQWIINNNCPLGPLITHLACKKGHLHILQWFYEYISHLPNNIILDYYNENIYDIALEKKYLNIIDWLNIIGIKSK